MHKLIHCNNSNLDTSLKFIQSENTQALINSLATLLSSSSDETSNTDNQEKHYFDTTSIKQLKISNTSLGILHLNISSISSHINDLKIMLSLMKTKVDIICITRE